MWDLGHFGPKEYSACIVAALILVVLSKHRVRRTVKLPPGPPRLPIIGNLHQMTASRLWEKATEWRDQYGDIVYVENIGKPLLILNSYEVASELLDNRSAIYSSRPNLIMAMELQGWAWVTSMLPYCEKLRQHRAYLHRFFQTPEALNYFELQERETCVMLNGLLHSPEKYADHVRRLPGAVILKNVYGYEVQKLNDPMVQSGEQVLRRGGESLQYILLDFLPWCHPANPIPVKHVPEWTPFVKFPKVAREGRQTVATFKSMTRELARKQVMEENAGQSMASILLSENMKDDGSIDDEQNIYDASAMAFLGGTDTSVTAIMTFILAILKNPDKQSRAQVEIDGAIGTDRLPTVSDVDALPYVQAICTEILRWEVILPLGIAHNLTENDEYMGYHIPAGTMVVPNVWSMALDERYYPDPLSFKPERWMPGETKEGVPSLMPQDYVFGLGRRICSGKKWAEHIVFLAVASILATFHIEKGKTANGETIPPNDNYLPSILRALGPSQCKITPRSEKAASLIRQSVAAL
ncbi:cytochrome P450 [Schizopora paradoxa]|uniref:Cytochrome P450 n=1 Tax=Schizopora paradoxa TaxID=27342 RepID=A0A0H2RBN0_9AGAM|nr:cytochrome P450 [Schizopora paradoxa]